MAYSIRYGSKVKRRKRPDRSGCFAVMALVFAMVLRIFGGSYLDNAQTLLFGEAEAVTAFYEDFVKDGS